MHDDRADVLLVDDNEEILETTRRYLRRRGLQVITTDSPLGVSAIVRHAQPGVIVLDVMMPALDGDGLARVLKSNGLTKTTEIIFYSAMDEERLYAIASAVPGSSYVSKADGLSSLYEAIRSKLHSGASAGAPGSPGGARGPLA